VSLHPDDYPRVIPLLYRLCCADIATRQRIRPIYVAAERTGDWSAFVAEAEKLPVAETVPKR
jgi:hypothetical protein